MRLRSLLVVASAGALAGGLLAFGCSDDAPGVQGGDPGVQLGTVDGGARADGSAVGPADASPDAPADGGGEENILACVDGTDLRVDGGASAPLACPAVASCSGLCTRVAGRYKRGVAQAAIACLDELGACSAAPAARSCVARAVGRACPDATSASFCTPLVMACDPSAGGAGSNISQADCERFTNALSASGRSTLEGCIEAKIAGGTCASDVGDCFRALEE